MSQAAGVRLPRLNPARTEVGAQGDIPFRSPFGKKLLVLLAKRVLDEARPGSIILLHDGWARKPGTLEATGRIIEALQARGYRFVTVSELLARRH